MRQEEKKGKFAGSESGGGQMPSNDCFGELILAVLDHSHVFGPLDSDPCLCAVTRRGSA